MFPSSEDSSVIEKTSDVESKLRRELKKLLASKSFQTSDDVDQMTNILMGKLMQIAQEEDSSIQDSHTESIQEFPSHNIESSAKGELFYTGKFELKDENLDTLQSDLEDSGNIVNRKNGDEIVVDTVIREAKEKEEKNMEK